MVMKFYRPAVSEDFGSFVHDFPEEVETWVSRAVESGNRDLLVVAEEFLMSQYQSFSSTAVERVRAYYAFLLARDDFHKGKPVYVEYSVGL